MSENNILEEIKDFIFQEFKTKLSAEFVYHNYNHTLDVVKAAKEIGKGENISEKDLEIVTIAAWFHDIGHVNSYKDHEEESKKIAKEFLENKNYPKEAIEKVLGCINATKIPQSPKNLLEQILCDADLFHFGNADCFEKSDLLRAEWEILDVQKFSDIAWLENTLDFLKSHRFCTDYAFEKLNGTKAENLLKLKEKLRKAKAKKSEITEKKKAKKEAEKKKEERENIPEKGIETMFRVQLRNHIKLSDIADTKANILLSVNAIILSLMLSQLAPKLDKHSNAYLIAPTLIFLFSSLLTMIFAILSTKPKITSGTFNKDDIKKKKVNILFFGNFHKMPLSDFEWGINSIMKDKDYLYGALTKDLYFLGKVLDKKYRLLRITYTIFMIGIIFSVMTFIVAFYTIDTPMLKNY
ncbi:Pycsar system effector family protein [Aureivirga sp. CE67]|uniref:Pycsar system effector family protein n=1 Tax=Aureivirga sp. CE67 TaxID=1788983 RepID=UPI0018CAA0E8|nr:Pycsar system effector family protein [Aureivirga sp. CE67]